MSTNYKDTLLMPKTGFEMKASLSTKEPIFIKRWIDEKVYQSINQDKNRKTTFVLHDGPPFANGNLHTGHAVNKVLKDIIVRDNALNGKKVSWKIGWDTHGLPIETAIKKANPNFDKAFKDDIEYINACFDYAKGQVLNQNKQFQRMALLTDFEDYYATYQKDFEARQIGVLASMFDKQLIYRDLKPVFWSPTSKSALAEAEVEYQNKESHSIFVGYELEKTKNTFLVIWTTTPWTLVGNVAVAIKEDANYVFLAFDGKTYIVAEALIPNFTNHVKHEFVHQKTVKGKELVGLTYIHPINDGEKGIVLVSDHVEMESGTGLVHIAGGHGIDDFHLAKKNKLKTNSVMDDGGVIIVPGIANGLFYEKAIDVILEEITKRKTLLSHSKITHSYPHDWRTKKPIVYRATTQWFVSIEKVKTNVVSAINNVEWFPKWGKERITSMIVNRDDWTISRQRKWGVPIAVIYDEKGQVVNTPKTWKRIADMFAKEGAISWRTHSIEEILGDEFKKGVSYKKELDIMDVWFDSGTSWTMLEGQISDLYLEGSDQHRGWFNSSLITSTIINNRAPYRKVLTHGFVNDEHGNKMSKSIGNVIDPLVIANETGIEIIRLWIGLSNYKTEIAISKNILTQIGESYRKIRNTLKFMLGNLDDFENKHKVEFSKLEVVDKYIIDEFNKVIKEVRSDFAEYDFWKGLTTAIAFINDRLSNFYFDFSKDILYVEKADSVRRRQVQTVIDYVFNHLLYVFGPFLPVTIEEAYDFYKLRKDVKSFWLTTSPELKEVTNVVDISYYFEVKELINVEIEKARTAKLLGKSLEAKVTINTDKTELLESLNMPQLLIVSQVKLVKADTLSVNVDKATGHKCERCWIVYEKLANDEICHRCLAAIK